MKAKPSVRCGEVRDLGRERAEVLGVRVSKERNVQGGR